MFSIKEFKKPFFLIMSIFLGSALFSQSYAFEGCIGTCEATGPLTNPPVIYPPFPQGTSSETHYWTNDIPAEGLPLGTHTVICKLIKRSDGSVALTDESTIEIVDTRGPIFDPEFTGTRDDYITAVDYYTTLTPELLGYTPTATDLVDQNVTVSLLGVQGSTPEEYSLKLTTGYHYTVFWKAEDAQGNSSLIAHLVTIKPEANMLQPAITEIGGDAVITVQLNGKAISQYDYYGKPGREARAALDGVSFDVLFTGTVIDKMGRVPRPTNAPSEYEARPPGYYRELIINRGESSGEITFNIPDNINITSDDTLIATIDDSYGLVELGDNVSKEVKLTDQNIAPLVKLKAFTYYNPCPARPSPNEKSARCSPTKIYGSVYDHSSTERVYVEAEIINEGLTSTAWYVDSVANESEGSYSRSFRPVDSTANIVTFTFTSTDSGGLATTETLEIVLTSDSVPSLSGGDTDGDGTSDHDEGLSDTDADGIPDYLDNDPNVSQLPLTGPLGGKSDPMFVDAGITLTLGNTKRTADGFRADDATISNDNLSEHGNDGQAASGTTDSDYPFENRITAMIDFEIRGFNAGETITVVIPLPEGASIPAYAQYRKYTADKKWNDFVVNSKNALSSAPRNSNDTCPAYGSDYTNGLTIGHHCIALSIEDGGPNDTDGTVNGVIVDPGVLAIGNLAPTAVATVTIPRVDEGKWGELNGSASTDPENATLTYTWTQTAGPAVIELETGGKYSFIAPQVTQDTTLTFTLSVHDGLNSSNTVTLSFIVKDTTETTDSSGSTNNDGSTTTTTTTTSGSKAASSHLLILLLLPIALFRIRHTRKTQ